MDIARSHCKRSARGPLCYHGSKQLFGVVFDPRPPTYGLAGVHLQKVRGNGLYFMTLVFGSVFEACEKHIQEKNSALGIEKLHW